MVTGIKIKRWQRRRQPELAQAGQEPDTRYKKASRWGNVQLFGKLSELLGFSSCLASWLCGIRKVIYFSCAEGEEGAIVKIIIRPRCWVCHFCYSSLQEATLNARLFSTKHLN